MLTMVVENRGTKIVNQLQVLQEFELTTILMPLKYQRATLC